MSLLCTLVMFISSASESQIPGLAHESIEFEGVPFEVVSIDMNSFELRLFWKAPDGKPYGTLSSLVSGLSEKGRKVLFAANAGIYDKAGAPLGLYVEDGIERIPLNRSNGGGNFFVRPNGVFFVEHGMAQIKTTEDYVKCQPRPTMATQSGPMLLVNGEINKEFRKESTNRFVRSGVGVDSRGNSVFLLSRLPVNLYTFAQCFRENLGYKNALYLDGAISGFYVGGREYDQGDFHFAGMIAALPRNDGDPVMRKTKDDSVQP